MDNLLKDKAEVRSVNSSVEEKLDRIIELLEKLVPQSVTINSPISVGKDFDATKFNEAVEHITDRITRAKVLNIKSIKGTSYEPMKVNINIADERGTVSDLVGHIQEDGSIICEPFVQDRTIVGWGLGK